MTNNASIIFNTRIILTPNRCTASRFSSVTRTG